MLQAQSGQKRTGSAPCSGLFNFRRNVAQLTMGESLLALGFAINKKLKNPSPMPSLRSHLLVAFLRVTRRKRIYSSIDAMVDGIKKVRQQGPARATPGMRGDVVVGRGIVDNVEV